MTQQDSAQSPHSTSGLSGAVTRLSQSWFPPNPELLHKLRSGFEAGLYDHDLDFLIGGSTMKFESFDLVDKTHQSLANFFNVLQEDIALVPNFSLGLNLILEGLHKDSRILLLEADYPSVNWPFESRGYPISYVPADANLEDAGFRISFCFCF